MIGDVNKSVIADRDKKKKVNELYVDVFERLNCMMNLHGEVISANMLLGIILIVAGSLCTIIPGILDAKRLPVKAE